MSETKNIDKIRFIVGSILGIIIFFIKLPLGGSMILPIDFITAAMQNLLMPYIRYIVLVAGIYLLYSLIKNKFWTRSPFQVFIDLTGILCLVLVICDLLGIMPAFFASVYESSLMTMGKFFIMIATIMYFLPPLVSYGLPEAIGVFVRPITRPIFNLPGKSAVIVVSAFMGNFTAGHVETDTLLGQGSITQKEAAIIATGFCTSSIGLILSVVSAAGNSAHFTLLFFLIFLCTMVITAITAHIYPLNRQSEQYLEGVTPAPENYPKGNPFQVAFNEGCNICKGSQSILKKMLVFGTKSLPMVCAINVCGIGTMIVFTLLNQYTPVFQWIGMLFYPLIALVGFPEVSTVASAVGINAVDNVTSQLMLAANESLAPMTRIFGAGFGIMSVIFFGAYLSSLYNTRIRMKIKDLVIVWAERTALTILLWGFIAKILAGIF